MDEYIDKLFYNPEQDERTRRSIRPLTDQEIEQLANQPKLETTHGRKGMRDLETR